jgi:hypothetical protein
VTAQVFKEAPQFLAGTVGGAKRKPPSWSKATASVQAF